MEIPLVIADAFADRPFSGNPAAVCLLDRPEDDGWMQAVAGELGVPETAFVLPRADGFGLRWFTPSVEVDLCGHATLAAAHVLWQEARLAASGAARFHTRSGLLTATREDDRIVLDFPAEPAAEAPAPPGLLDALGVEARWVGRNRMDYLVEVAPESVVRGLAPDLVRLATVPTRGVIVTSASGGPQDFVSRFFAPRAGIPEDPVTGSAHCCLGPYWRPRVGRDSMVGYQASPRGGEVRVRVAGDRVHLGGRAVTVLRGHVAR